MAVGSLACAHRETTHPTESPLDIRRVSPIDEHAYHSPTISPDGETFAFVQKPNVYSIDRQIWLRGVNGGPAKQLTHFSGVAVAPTFTPDGRHIVYFREKPLPWVRYLDGPPPIPGAPLEMMATSGGPATTLIHSAYSAAISPDGKWIAFLQYVRVPRNPQPEWKLMLMPFPAGPVRELTAVARIAPQAVIPAFRWTPDSTHLLVPGYRQSQSGGLAIHDWFLVPLAGTDARSTGAHELFASLGWVPEPIALYRDRIFFRLFGEAPNISEVRWDQSGTRVIGPIRHTIAGAWVYGFNVSSSGLVATSTDTHYDFHFLPMDIAKGELTGAMRRVNDKWHGDFDSFVSPLSAIALYRTSYPAMQSTTSLDLRTGGEALLSRGAISHPIPEPHLSPDGNLLAEYERASSGSPIWLRTMNDPKTSRRFCSNCGLALGFSPDSKFLLVAGQDPGQMLSPPTSTLYTLDISDSHRHRWFHFDHDARVISVLGSFGHNWDWIALRFVEYGHEEDYLIPWNPAGAPGRSEWVRLPPNSLFSGGSDWVFEWSGAMLSKRRLDRASRRFSPPQPVPNWPDRELASIRDHENQHFPDLRPKHVLTLGPAGVLVARRAAASVWLMKLPDPRKADNEIRSASPK
ncbi:MAG: PD40 domain-containing protein [Acidobacteria bacterium]|nr:PD40 domain-containing protein [Acidobacteriota bacterium]